MPRAAPRSAASLVTPGLLTPQQVVAEEAAPPPTPPPEFDWKDSGLTNPLAGEAGETCCLHCSPHCSHRCSGPTLTLLDIEFFTKPGSPAGTGGSKSVTPPLACPVCCVALCLTTANPGQHDILLS